MQPLNLGIFCCMLDWNRILTWSSGGTSNCRYVYSLTDILFLRHPSVCTKIYIWVTDRLTDKLNIIPRLYGGNFHTSHMCACSHKHKLIWYCMHSQTSTDQLTKYRKCSTHWDSKFHHSSAAKQQQMHLQQTCTRSKQFNRTLRIRTANASWLYSSSLGVSNAFSPTGQFLFHVIPIFQNLVLKNKQQWPLANKASNYVMPRFGATSKQDPALLSLCT